MMKVFLNEERTKHISHNTGTEPDNKVYRYKLNEFWKSHPVFFLATVCPCAACVEVFEDFRSLFSPTHHLNGSPLFLVVKLSILGGKQAILLGH